MSASSPANREVPAAAASLRKASATGPKAMNARSVPVLTRIGRSGRLEPTS